MSLISVLAYTNDSGKRVQFTVTYFYSNENTNVCRFVNILIKFFHVTTWR